ncbi:MAG: hypothetical protein J6336_13865 [Kiritimatiellae bacterium]|nr:hypothetical protein [Kiritimatiellia bacterium]
MMKWMRRGGCRRWFPLAVLAVVTCASAEVTVRQEITLSRGWNAVYMEVSPLTGPDAVFAGWPVNSVGFYDPAAFLATRQFSQDWDSRGLSMNPIAKWHRDYPVASPVTFIPAGTVCLVFNTNDTSTAVSVTGVPAAPRLTWHITDTNLVYNFVGISLQHGESVSPMDYLEGFPGNFLKDGLYRISGNDEDRTQSYIPIYSSSTVSDGDVLLVASDLQCDWSGVLNVSPMSGIDFGMESSKATLTIRNDGASARTVAVDLFTDAAWGEVALPRSAIRIRDTAVARTNAVWTALEGGADVMSGPVATKRLEADETWKMEIGIDRTAFDTGVKGRPFGALLRITDQDGRSKMRVDVPFKGETSGGIAADRAWPGGLWVAEVAFNRILAPGDKVTTESGGTATIRLPIHIDADGRLRLLQRVVAAGETTDSGSFEYRLYAGSAYVPATARQVMRISAVCLPTETPVIPATGGAMAPESGNGVVFEFTVAGGGATSLLRHPLHPQHDGLRWDFKTPTPSGDDLANYKGDVKPETFSVRNRIEITLNLNGGEAAWNPEDSKSGTCRWTFSNLMRQGDITLEGDMTIKRVSPLTELILE